MNQIIVDRNNIIDREDEIDSMEREMLEANKLKINILFAPTAIGKSSITQKFYSVKCQEKTCILVRTPPINNGVAPSWKYLDYIFKESRDILSKTPYSFDNFMENYLINTQSHVIDALGEASNKIDLGFKMLGHKLNETINGYDSFIEDKKKAFIYEQAYIHFIFSKLSLILIVDNLQNIDEETLSFLRRLFVLNKLRKHFIIFEYTQKDQNDNLVLNFASYLADGDIDVKCLPVKKTNETFIIDIVDKSIYQKPKAPEFNKDLINFYLSTNTGNIREVLDFTRSYKESTNVTISPTLIILETLNDSALFILFTISLFGGTVSKTILNNICRKEAWVNLEKEIPQLLSKDLISESAVNYSTAHASIIDSLKSSTRSTAIATLSTTATKKYIENEIKANEGIRLECLRVLLEIYKNTDAAQISRFFNLIEKNIIIGLNISDVWQYLNAFIEVTISNFQNYISMYISILKICFKFELYKQGYEQCLLKIEQKIKIETSPILMLFKMMYLSALDQHKENIDYFKKHINQVNNNPRLLLNMYLIILASYRSLGQVEKCFDVHKELKKRKYKKLIEYGYRNRLVDVYMDRKKSIPYLKKSIRYFKKTKNYTQAGKSLISYTHVLGALGKIQQAIHVIDEAAELLQNQIIGNHMILVNKAALLLLSGKYDIEIYNMLDLAEASAIVPFDKLAIIINKLVWCIENERYDMVQLFENTSLELVKKEPDIHIHSLLYYNFYILYSKMGDYENASIYLQKAKDTMDYCIPVKCRINNTPTSETRFILSKPWHICYLCYWTYDILYDETSSS